jgi:drug/metabolite transporter (DMT)-like permease
VVVAAVFASVGCAITWAVASVLFARALRDVEGGTPQALNLVKCALAFPGLVVVGLLGGEGWPSPAAHGLTLLASAALGLAVSDTAYFVALNRLGVARGVLFIPLNPVVTALLAAAWLGDPFGPVELAGMGLVIGGIVLVLVPGPGASSVPSSGRTRRDVVIGVLAGVGAALAQGASNVLMKQAVTAVSASHVAALRIGYGGLVLAVIIAVTGGPRTVAPFLRRGARGPIVIASAVGTFLGMWLGTWGAKGLPIGVATTLAGTTPVWALALARLTGERVTPRAVVGAVVAILGVVVLASSTSR